MFVTGAHIYTHTHSLCMFTHSHAYTLTCIHTHIHSLTRAHTHTHTHTHTGGIRTKDAREVLFARQAVVTEAKAFGLDAIDLVDTDYKGKCRIYLSSFVSPILWGESQVILIRASFRGRQDGTFAPLCAPLGNLNPPCQTVFQRAFSPLGDFPK